MHRIIRLIVCSFFINSLLFSQTPDYPKGYFRWPLDLKPEIVANLGELRSNHWHMGLDIRTNQKENQRVFAAAEGYIAYIGVRPLSFGRFIIINHPNGFSTLYAHLNDFAPAIEKYVTDEQYKAGSWAAEITLPKEKFPVIKGSFIAYSGNTGGSQGPHLHFEIRDTKTGKCLNPLLFGFSLQDNVRPSIVKLALYDRTKSTYHVSPQFFALKHTDSGYIVPKSSIVTGYEKISFGLQAFDRISGSNNEDGIYSASLSMDGQPVISFVMDQVGYDETSYLNAHIDYKFRYNGGIFVQHLSKLPGNRGSVYHPVSGDGVVHLTDTVQHTIRIEVRDAYQNISVLNFKIRLDPALAKPATTAPVQPFIPNYVNVLDKPDFEIYLPEVCLYDTVNSFYYRNDNRSENSVAVSAAHQVNDASVPVHDDLRVRIKPNRVIPQEWKDKIVIQRTYREGRNVKKAVPVGNSPEGEWLSAEFGDFGVFQAFADIVPPTINELGKGDTVNLSAAKRIVFTPNDNFGIKSFRAELDGRWLRFTNDKGRSWIYQFDERCPYGVHVLNVTVEDLVGNKTVKKWWFKKYPYTPPPPKKKKAAKKSSSKNKTTTKKK